MSKKPQEVPVFASAMECGLVSPPLPKPVETIQGYSERYPVVRKHLRKIRTRQRNEDLQKMMEAKERYRSMSMLFASLTIVICAWELIRSVIQ